MTYDAYETSVEGGDPVELYTFALSTDTDRFTSAQNDETIGGNTYTADILKSARMVVASDEKSSKVAVTVPANNVFVERYLATPPGQRATMTIHRFHRSDSAEELAVLYKGIVKSVGFSKNGREAKIVAESFAGLKGHTLPRVTYQNLCNYVVYGSRCKVLESSFEHNFTVSAVSGDVITVPGASAEGADYFEAGMVEFQQDYRLVVSQSGNDLTILVPFATSPLGSQVRCVAGCKHRLSEDCDTKFANPINYGGFQHVPTKNPFETGLD